MMLRRETLRTAVSVAEIVSDARLEEADGLADLVGRAGEDPESLSTAERARYLAYEHIFFDSWEGARPSKPADPAARSPGAPSR